MNATLAEDLLLVALDPERRAPAATTRAGLAHGLAGGLLLDLLLRGPGEVSGHVLLARPGRVTGDELLDDVLARVRASRPHSVEGWIRILARHAGSLRMRLVRRLVQARVLREETSRVLGVVPVRRYAVDDQAALKELRTRLRSALLGDGALDPRTASLVALVDACGLVDGLVTAPQRRGARRRAAQLTDRDPAAASVTAAIRRAQVHIVAGAAAAAVTSTTPTS